MFVFRNDNGELAIRYNNHVLSFARNSTSDSGIFGSTFWPNWRGYVCYSQRREFFSWWLHFWLIESGFSCFFGSMKSETFFLTQTSVKCITPRVVQEINVSFSLGTYHTDLEFRYYGKIFVAILIKSSATWNHIILSKYGLHIRRRKHNNFR